MDGLTGLMGGGESGKSGWLGVASEVRNWALLAIGLVICWQLSGVRTYEAESAKAKATRDQLETKRVSRPVLVGCVETSHSATINDVRQVGLTLRLENTSLVDVRVKKIVSRVMYGDPKEEMRSALNATQEIAWLESSPPAQQATDTSSDDSVVQATFEGQEKKVQEHIDKLYKTAPHGRIFSVGMPSPNLDWYELTNQRQTNFKEVTVSPEQKWWFPQTYLVTEIPNFLGRRWFNVRFEVTIDDPEAPGGERMQAFCCFFPDKPMATTIRDADGRELSVGIQPFPTSMPCDCEDDIDAHIKAAAHEEPRSP